VSEFSNDIESNGAPLNPPKPMEQLVRRIIDSLPLLDKKAVAAALDEVKARPRSALHYLFDNISSTNSATRSIVGYLVARCGGGSDVIDNLNAVIFDADQPDEIKVSANDILAELGSPVDPDVFAMSVPNAEELRATLRTHAMDMLARGDVEHAVAHARALEATDRYLLIHDAAARHPDCAVSFMKPLASDAPDNAMAVVNAIGSEALPDGVGLLKTLAESDDRTLQKLIKRTLFEMRKAGVEVPEEKPEPDAAPVRRSSTGEWSEFRCLLSEPTSGGLILSVMAWTNPKGRLRVFTVLLDPWKRGIERAAFRTGMSKSSFARFISSQSGSRMDLTETTADACLAAIARGLRVARELGTPVPLDFGLGKPFLGDIDREAERIEHPFTCSRCQAPLDAESIRRIRELAAYDNIPAETRCIACRSKTSDSEVNP